MPNLSDLLKIAVPAGVQLAGGLNASNAQGDATNTLSSGAQQGIDTISGGSTQARKSLADIMAQQKSTLQPFIDAGKGSLEDLTAGLKSGGGLADPFTWIPSDLQNDPIFQRRLKQGMDAIQAKGNAGGTRFSGASMKDFADYSTGAANDYMAQDYARQENTYRQNEKDRYDRLMGLTGVSQGAANKTVDAEGTYGTNLANIDTSTAQHIAELQTQKASAEAAGETAKAATINQTISSILDGIDKAGTAKSLADLANPAAKVAAPVAGAAIPLAGATGASGTAATLGTAGLPFGVSSTGGTSLAGAGAAVAAPGAAPLTGYAGGGLVTSHGAMIGMLSNPITILAGAGIIGLTALIKSQAHHEASQWVSQFQDKFDANLDEINRGFHAAAQSGQLDKATAQAIRNEAAAAIQQYEQKRQEFASQGSDKKKVAGQALETFNKYYGANGTDFLGKMDAAIAGLQ